MDAKHSLLVLCAAAALLIAGCAALTGKPTLQSAPSEPNKPAPQRQVVEAPTPNAEGGTDASATVDQAVQSYIQQLDGVAQRARRETGGNPVSEAAMVQLLPAAPPPELSVPMSAATVPAPAPATAMQEAESDDSASSVEASAVEPAPPAAPPKLRDAAVRPAESREPSTSSARPPERTSVNAAAVAQHAPISLEQFVSQWPIDGTDSSFAKQLDLRVLRALAGDYEAARQPLTCVSDAQQAMAARLVESLIAIRDAHDGDPVGAAVKVREQIDQLRDNLRRLCELRISTLAICREVRGYGDYRPIEPAHFPAGAASEFVLYCELQDFVSEKQEDGLYHAQFDMRTVLLNRSGEVVLEIRDDGVQDRCRQPRQDCFIPRLVRLPATLGPGEYVAKVTVVDTLGDKLAESRVTLKVVSPP